MTLSLLDILLVLNMNDNDSVILYDENGQQQSSRLRFTIFFKKLWFLAYISGAAEHTFTKLLPMVDLGCVQIPQYLGSCDVFPKLHGGPKNVKILHIFGSPYSHAQMWQNIVILK